MADQLKTDILEEYAKHGSLFRTARNLKVEVIYVKQIVDAQPSEVAPDLSECRWDGFGDPEKADFLVARMPATEVWDNTIPEVAEARQRFEEGTHNMATGRDGPYILLYSFPRHTKRPQPNYFSLTAEG